ncbi:hypothetical protein QCA50_006833 [Cerrena zonata]|uniref:Uncharacterized protein n=1 Tax=Cerrena zonata TaxID=2478898 RepID=A0AAW0GF02_9APHY
MRGMSNHENLIPPAQREVGGVSFSIAPSRGPFSYWNVTLTEIPPRAQECILFLSFPRRLICNSTFMSIILPVIHPFRLPSECHALCVFNRTIMDLTIHSYIVIGYLQQTRLADGFHPLT